MQVNNLLNVIFSILLVIYFAIVLVIGRFLVYHDMFKSRKHPRGSILLKNFDYHDIEFCGENNILLKGWFIKSPENPSNKTLFVLHGWRRNRSYYLSQAK